MNKHFVVAAFLCASPALAQAPIAEFQQWSAVMATAHFSKDTPALALWLDVQVRRGADNTAMMARPGIGLQALPWLSLWAGYAWVPTFPDGLAEVVHEHRVWEQVLLAYETSFRLNLQSRTRVEQRFHESGGAVGVRLRQLARVSWRPSAEVPVGGLVSDEVFIGLNSTAWGQPAGFDQNRLFVGPFFQLTPWARIEAGYLFVYLNRGVDRIFHTFLTQLVLYPKW